MSGDAETALLYRIAATIGATAEELRDRLLAHELYEWDAYFTLKAEAEKAELDLAKSERDKPRAAPVRRRKAR